ncbi:hypothetical protein [Sphingobium sp.]|uniref:hypothetical protein n=1 Tax=Sphingobium sp. TaxID=1912891 RepID=UPI0035C735EC
MSNTYLGPDNVDDLGRMVTALLTELWITRDRLAVLEHVLETRGIVMPEEINDHIPDAGFEARLEMLRDRMVGNVIGAPLAARERSVDQILARAGMKRPTAEDEKA